MQERLTQHRTDLGEQADLVWQQQVAVLYMQLAKFTDDLDSGRVQRGLQRLAADIVAFPVKRYTLRPISEIDWRAVGDAVRGFIERNIPENRPPIFKVEPMVTSKTGTRQAGNSGISRIPMPRAFSMLFDYYGLSGEPMNYAQLSRKYDFVSHDRPKQILRTNSRHYLQRDETIQKLILANPPVPIRRPI